MRSAGCTINDMADKDFDKAVGESPYACDTLGSLKLASATCAQKEQKIDP
jgi:4-hydroxybenzoate polyprenyltransferase